MVPTIPKLAPSSSDDGTTVVVTVVVVTVCCCCCCTRGGGTGCGGGCGNATAFAAAVTPAGLGGAMTSTGAGVLPVRDGIVGGGACVWTFPVSADDGGGAFAGVGPGGDGTGVDGVGSAVTLIIGLGDCGLVPIADDD